jgi:hypothetical protein
VDVLLPTDVAEAFSFKESVADDDLVPISRISTSDEMFSDYFLCRNKGLNFATSHLYYLCGDCFGKV